MRKVKRRGAAELENEDFEHDRDFLLTATGYVQMALVQ
ncbi:MAG: hypothetical protein K0R44_1882 [Thermomicrobiales bacterium]|jgi:hypothetical protein|nr:hypothetical protein [Thermomicrobiales bacterium]